MTTNPTPPASTGDEVDLCKGCGTMKHLNTEGYCGRCQSDIRSRYPINTFSRQVQDEIIELFSDKKAINNINREESVVIKKLLTELNNYIPDEDMPVVERLIATHDAGIERVARIEQIMEDFADLSLSLDIDEADLIQWRIKMITEKEALTAPTGKEKI